MQQSSRDQQSSKDSSNVRLGRQRIVAIWAGFMILCSVEKEHPWDWRMCRPPEPPLACGHFSWSGTAVCFVFVYIVFFPVSDLVQNRFLDPPEASMSNRSGLIRPNPRQSGLDSLDRLILWGF